MKVAPVTADLPEDTYSSQDITGSVPEPKFAQPMAPDATLPKMRDAKNKTRPVNCNQDSFPRHARVGGDP
jgi:hypothetical protein